jgi:hypothetical protein
VQPKKLPWSNPAHFENQKKALLDAGPFLLEPIQSETHSARFGGADQNQLPLFPASYYP